MKRAALLLVFAGCAHVPTELAEARDDLTLAREGADLGAARAAIDLATYEHELNGESAKAKDLTYIARRRIDIANSKVRKHDEQVQLAALKAAKARRDRQRAEIEEQAARLPPLPPAPRPLAPLPIVVQRAR